MTCEHDWIFSTPCPKCAAAAAEPVTGAVTTDDELAIPDFLMRAPDNTFLYPELHKTVLRVPSGGQPPKKVLMPTDPLDSLAAVAQMERVAPPPMFPEGWEDLPVRERQPYMRKMHAIKEQARARAAREKKLGKPEDQE